jgi:hypothetical protein
LILKVSNLNWAWWPTPVTEALGRPRQEDCKFKASPGLYGKTQFQKTEKTKKLKLKRTLKTK